MQKFRQNALALSNLLVAVVVILATAAGVYVVVGMDKTGRQGNRLEKVYQYDPDTLPVTDPAMITYVQTAEIATGLGDLRGVAVGPDGKIIAAGDERLEVFDLTGKRTGTIKLPGQPRCLAVAADGTMFVALKDRLIVLGADGAVLARWPVLPGRPMISSVSVTPDSKHVFIADRGDGWVVHCDGSGNVLNYIGRDDAGKADHFKVQLVSCFDLAVDGEELLVIDPARYAVETYSFDGMLQSRWEGPTKGIEGFFGCCNPTDLAVSGSAIVTAQKGAYLPRIKMYDKNGKFLTVVAGPNSFADDGSLIDLAVDGGGRILACDTARKSIRVFEKKP